MNEIAKKKAELKGDCCEWSHVDALEDALKDLSVVDKKDVQLVIHYLLKLPNGGQEHHYIAAGMTTAQHIALLTLGKDRVVREWRG